MKNRIVSLVVVFVMLSLLIAPATVSASTPVAPNAAPVTVETKVEQPSQIMRFLRINVYVKACDSVWSGFPPMLNPVNCTPLNMAFWEYNYNGSNFVAGPATNVNGYAYTDFPVQANYGGTIQCRGYQMIHSVSYTATQPSITCYLYSVRS